MYHSEHYLYVLFWFTHYLETKTISLYPYVSIPLSGYHESLVLSTFFYWGMRIFFLLAYDSVRRNVVEWYSYPTSLYLLNSNCY
ncbi:hypothetical protein QR685DRAFT_184233 [Neurospora intermedia]|uniref:Uncharacterized protein n=1 Tax=Neurospora intermedia TaxID=5142 RepID=A0ABR3DM46_NEUIN